MNRTNQPQRYILVAISGSKPQIVTETLYYLRIKEKPIVPISEIYIITTSKGKKVSWEKLGGSGGAIAQFCEAYNIEPTDIDFTENHIITIKDAKGNDLEDIRTRDHNRILRAQLLGFVKALTTDENTVLYCAMGGGRRTMSAYLMLALTLYGRENDRLTHVLINEEFDTNHDFFFPRKDNELVPVLTADGKLAIRKTKQANLQLARIPFIRLRSRISEDHREDIEEDIEKDLIEAQFNIDNPQQPKLMINIAQGSFEYDGQAITLKGFNLALLIYYAENKKKRCVKKDGTCDDCEKCFQTPHEIDVERFLQIYKPLFQQEPKAFEKLAQRYRSAKIMSPDSIRPAHTAIEEALKHFPRPVGIARKSGQGLTRYGLSLDKTCIEFIEPTFDSNQKS